MSLNPGQFITPPDAEEAAVAALSDLAPYVATEWPRTLPESFIVVSLAGGEVLNLVQAEASVLVEAFGPSSVDASELARTAHARLSNLALGWPGVDVTRCRCTFPVNYPDPRTSKPRYQFTASAVITMEVLS